MSEPMPICKGRYCPRTVEHPAYLTKCGGYCFECWNNSVPDLESDLAARDRQLAELREKARVARANEVLENGLSRYSVMCTADASSVSACDCMACRSCRWHAAVGSILAALLPPTPKEDDRAAKE